MEKKKEILFWKEDVQTCNQSCHAFFFFASKNNILLYSNDVQAKLLFLL